MDKDFKLKVNKAVMEKYGALSPETALLSDLWQDYCAIKSHLTLLSSVVITGNQSAALQFAIQSEGIMANKK